MSAPGAHPPSPNGNKKDDLLLKLGKIAGIGGITAGIFFELMSGLQPQLFSAQTTQLFMFLCFGVAVVGLAIWAAQTTGGVVIPIALLVFACILLVIGWLTIRAPQREGKFDITVNNPYGPTVTDTIVTCGTGCSAALDMGTLVWKATVSSAEQADKLTVTAESRDGTLKSSQTVSFKNAQWEPADITLKSTGLRNISGFIKYQGGGPAPGASVIAIGFTGTQAEPDGTFKLRGIPDNISVDLDANLADKEAIFHGYRVGVDTPPTLELRPRRPFTAAPNPTNPQGNGNAPNSPKGDPSGPKTDPIGEKEPVISDPPKSDPPKPTPEPVALPVSPLVGRWKHTSQGKHNLPLLLTITSVLDGRVKGWSKRGTGSAIRIDDSSSFDGTRLIIVVNYTDVGKFKVIPLPRFTSHSVLELNGNELSGTYKEGDDPLNPGQPLTLVRCTGECE